MLDGQGRSWSADAKTFVVTHERRSATTTTTAVDNTDNHNNNNDDDNINNNIECKGAKKRRCSDGE